MRYFNRNHLHRHHHQLPRGWLPSSRLWTRNILQTKPLTKISTKWLTPTNILVWIRLPQLRIFVSLKTVLVHSVHNSRTLSYCNWFYSNTLSCCYNYHFSNNPCIDRCSEQNEYEVCWRFSGGKCYANSQGLSTLTETGLKQCPVDMFINTCYFAYWCQTLTLR